MKIAIGSDHAGFPLKKFAMDLLQNLGIAVVDMGTLSDEPVDYPDFAVKVGRAVQEKTVDRGILLCGSGVGACIAANKIKGVYAGTCHDTYSARQGVEHDNMNVLCVGARVIGEETLREIIQAFLSARYLGNNDGQERHARRVAKIKKIESENMV